MKNQSGGKGKTKKFLLLSVLIIVGRTYDATTTYLYTPDLANETNILVKFSGANWTGVMAIQLLLTGLTIGLLYFYFFKFVPNRPIDKNLTLKQFVSYLYYGNTHSFHKLFYKLPTDKRVLLASTGYIASMTLLCISYIVGTSTTLLLVSSRYRQLYQQGIPYLLYVLIGALAIGFAVKFFQTEYKKYRNGL